MSRSDVADRSGIADSRTLASSVLGLYEHCLEQAGRSKDNLEDDFMNPDQSRALLGRADDLGDKMLELMSTIGGGSKLYRLLVV